jgi:hypothetical protein
MSTERFTPQKGQVVTAQGYIGTFKTLDISADGHTADIQAFSLSKQMLLGAVIRGFPAVFWSTSKRMPAKPLLGS